MALPGMKDDRFVTMSLGTEGACTIRNSQAEHYNSLKLGPAAGRPTNLVHDIEGAQPSSLYKFTNKPSFYNPTDIRGTTSKKLIRDTNSIDYTLKLDDIAGAQPHPHTFNTKRVVDPLMPAYQLPSCQMADPLEPKFIRDAHSVADIQGTKSRPLYPYPQRDNQRCDDIEGAQAGWRPRNERVRMEAEPLTHHFDVRDINNLGFKSTRTVCPLKPEYRINGMVIRDDPRYTEPKPLPGPSNHDFFCLKTDDIEGAAPGWVPPHECRPAKEDRKHFRNTNFVGDIPGAQADTVKHAIRTERVVNPLNPVYDSLDGDRLRPPMTPNTLNGDPAKFGLSQPDSFKDAASNSRKQTPTSHKSVVDDVNVYEVSQPEVSSSARDEFVPPSSSRVPQMRIAEMNQTKDEKIASLERELTRLRSVSQGGGGGGGGSMSSRDSKQRSATMSASNFVASARSSNGNTQLVSTGRMPTERFTLRSGDNSANASARRPQPNFSKTGGKSRNTTARSSANMVSSRRESAALAAEIASVRDL